VKVSQGVKGYAAGKKVKGRKRHRVVDTLGLVWQRPRYTLSRRERLRQAGGLSGNFWLTQ
jgi:hypothetical protein